MALQLTKGPITSGGGDAVVCRDKNKIIIRAILLDIYEATNRYNLILMQSTGLLEEDYIRSVENTYKLQGFEQAFSEFEAKQSLNRFFKIVHYTFPGEKLPDIPDAGESVPLPEGCVLEQVAIFDDVGNYIKIDHEIWTAFDSLNKAALISHEFFYKYERGFNEKTSEGTRSTVAHVYSAQGMLLSAKDSIPDDSPLCMASDLNGGEIYLQEKTSAFYVYGDILDGGYPKITLQFTHLMGKPIVKKATVDILGIGFILAHGDPEFKEQHNDYVVWEKQCSYFDQIFPLVGSQYRDRFIRVEYIYGKPLKLSLYHNGFRVEESIVTNCFK